MSVRAAFGSLSGYGAHFMFARSTRHAPASVRGQLMRNAARTSATNVTRQASHCRR